MTNKTLFWLLALATSVTACKKVEYPTQQKPYPFGNGGKTTVVWTPSPYYKPTTTDTVTWYTFGAQIKPLFNDYDTVELVVDSSLAAQEYMKNRYLCSIWHMFADSLDSIQQEIGENILLGRGNLYVKEIDSTSFPHNGLTPMHGDGLHMSLNDAKRLNDKNFNVSIGGKNISREKVLELVATKSKQR